MPRIPTPAAARVFNLLEAFAKERRPLSNREVSRLLGLAESSCSDLIATLLQTGYLAREEGGRTVYPSSKLAELTRSLQREDQSLALPRRRAEELRDRTHESVLVGRIERGVVRVLVYCDGHFPMRYALPASRKISLHASGLGKALMAQLDESEAAKLLRLKPLKKLASGTPTSIRAVLRQLEQFRVQGYAYVENEGAEDVVSLAMAGVVDGRTMAISVAGPVSRMRLRFDRYLAAVRQTAGAMFEDEH